MTPIIEAPAGAASPTLAGSIPSFVVGDEYRRKSDIHQKYGGSRQNGISPSAHCPAIFIFTGDTGEQYGYKDGFDVAGVFSYSGEGQTGDMEFKSGNRSLRDHAKDGRAVHLFQALGKGKPCRYLGEFAVANHSIVRGPDKNGAERNIIVFHMMTVSEGPGTLEAPGEVVGDPYAGTLQQARAKAIAACSGPAGLAGKAAVQMLFQRSQAVRAYALLRAKGTCEACSLDAPFFGRDGQPYLEVHHANRVSDGGLDHPKFVAAICPTCHRRIHYGQGGEELNQKLLDWLAKNESDG
jgi:5-methylcytosine-specific restriction protein A